MITSSFLQNQKHETKTNRFIPIQPSQIGEVLKDNGFELVHLKTGNARLESRANHQTTIARYRSPDALKIDGLYMDLVFKVPHLYGSLEAFLGTYRQICGNGLTVGSKFFECPRIRHIGDALSQLNNAIPMMVAKHYELAECIRMMQTKDVTPNQVAEFVRDVAHLRLGNSENVVSIQYDDLMEVRRPADLGSDAFSVLNVVQENVMRFGLGYKVESTNDQGIKTLRNMNARPVAWTKRSGDTESIRSVDMNASIWDSASKILMVA